MMDTAEQKDNFFPAKSCLFLVPTLVKTLKNKWFQVQLDWSFTHSGAHRSRIGQWLAVPSPRQPPYLWLTGGSVCVHDYRGSQWKPTCHISGGTQSGYAHGQKCLHCQFGHFGLDALSHYYALDFSGNSIHDMAGNHWAFTLRYRCVIIFSSVWTLDKRKSLKTHDLSFFSLSLLLLCG